MPKRSKKMRASNKQRDSKTEPSRNNDLGDEEWSDCPVCGVKLKSRNLPSHGRKVHQEEFNTNPTENHRKERKKRVKNNSGRSEGIMPKFHLMDILFSVLIGSLLIIGGYFVYLYTYGDHDTPVSISNSDSDSDPSDEYQPVNENDGWLKSYSPRYDVDSDKDGWWIDYPSQHPETDTEVKHPQWILDELSAGPVIMLVHSQCEGCAQQTKEVPEVVKYYEDDIQLFDIDIYDNDKNYELATEIFDIYDPNEEAATIPITVLLSKIHQKDGNNIIIWHSAEGNTGKDWINGFVRDSIYYYQEQA